jgi:hypothetical protein
MTRITTLFLLLMFWSGAAFALVYQCRTREGNLFLTNNRNKFPPGCVQVGEPIGEEPAPSPPAAIPPAGQGREPGMNDRRRSSTPPPSQAPSEPREVTPPEAPLPEADVPADEVEMTPAGPQETDPGGANPVQSGEVPLQDDQADEGKDEGPDALDLPDQLNMNTPVEGGELPAEQASPAGEGEQDR